MVTETLFCSSIPLKSNFPELRTPCHIFKRLISSYASRSTLYPSERAIKLLIVRASWSFCPICQKRLFSTYNRTKKVIYYDSNHSQAPQLTQECINCLFLKMVVLTCLTQLFPESSSPAWTSTDRLRRRSHSHRLCHRARWS